MKKIISITALALVAIMSLAVFAACGPAADPDKAVEALEKHEYTAVKDGTVIPNALKILGVKGIEAVVKGSKTVKEDDKNKIETVTIVYFDSADSAKSAFDKVKDYAENNTEDDTDGDWTVKQSGKLIYWGTKAAINAAR